MKILESECIQQVENILYQLFVISRYMYGLSYVGIANVKLKYCDPL